MTRGSTQPSRLQDRTTQSSCSLRGRCVIGAISASTLGKLVNALRSFVYHDDDCDLVPIQWADPLQQLPSGPALRSVITVDPDIFLEADEIPANRDWGGGKHSHN